MFSAFLHHVGYTIVFCYCMRMMELLTSPIMVHATGIISFILIVLSFQCNVRKNILRTFASGMAFQCVHFTLLGALSAAAVVFFSIFRNILFEQKESYQWARHPWVFYSLLFSYTALSVLFWEGWISVLPLLGSYAATYALWMDMPRHIRIVTLVAASIWLLHAILIQSLSMIALNTFVLGSILLAMYRYDYKKTDEEPCIETTEKNT